MAEHDKVTGHPTVDAVVESLDQLSGRPVADHVAVFEAAAAALHEALSAVGGPAGPAGS